MKEKYKTELEAMRDFYEELGRIPDYSCNTDGRINGTFAEFKLNNSDGLSKIIKQGKGYIGSYNSAAFRLPYFLLIIIINQREYILINTNTWKITTKGKWKDPKDLLKFFNNNVYRKGWVDEYSIVSYNDLFYSNHSSVKKEDFIEEIETPKELNIEPYHWNKKGDMERSILDCLGGRALKKRLGAFFTPDGYVEISTKYLRNAISRIPEDWDYLILDRCAGTGNLEKFFTPEELSHCVLNTLVYAEWTTLKGLYEGRVRCIIPHTKDYKDPDGLLSDGDALTEKFDKVITDIITVERKKAEGKLVVIGLENPPYADETGNFHKRGTAPKKDFVKQKMEDSGISLICSRELANRFIWSAFNLLDVDEYIVYAPIKYWRAENITHSHYKFVEGYICNRKYFHASEAGVSLFHWKKTNTVQNNDSIITTNDIITGTHKISKVKERFNGFKFPRAVKEIAVLYINGLTIVPMGNSLRNTIQGSNSRKIGIDNSNILQALPLWVANCYKPKDYTEREVIMKSGDGGTAYQEDKDFLNDCFVWSCLTNENKCISNDQVKNELCLSQDTEADKLLDPNERNTRLLEKWQDIFKLVKSVKEYNPKFTYGLDQICRDINIQIETGDCRKDGSQIKAHKYDDLNNLIKEFKEQLNKFYNEYITPKLFKYELLK